MFNWFKKKSISDHLKESQRIKIKGFPFVIKKIDVLSYLQNDSVMVKLYDHYNNKKTNEAVNTTQNLEKIKEHYKQVIIAGCIYPKFSYKDEANSVLITDLFNDWEIAQELYSQIIQFTTGKKKFKQAMYQSRNALK